MTVSTTGQGSEPEEGEELDDDDAPQHQTDMENNR